MILCVNLNAAIDKTIVVDSFHFGEIHRPESVKSLPGGKGCNVARALLQLGAAPVVSGWVGGTAGHFIEAGLHEEGIATDFVRTGFESRTCTSILDSANQVMTEFYEKGYPIPDDKVAELHHRFRDIVGDYQAVTLSGSLPPGVSVDFYATLIRLANDAAVPVLLDSSGEALRVGVAAKPTLIKPNETEVMTLSERPPSTLVEFAESAGEIARRYNTIVVLSMGSRGAILALGRQTFHVRNPQVKAVSAVGSGDCLLAGLAYGLAEGLPMVEAAKVAIAAGTANALLIGAGQFTMTDFDEVFSSIEISQM